LAIDVIPTSSAQSVKDPANDRGLIITNPARNVLARAVWSVDRDVLVPERAASGDVAGSCLPKHGVERPLPGLLALELVGERVSDIMILSVGESSVRSRSSR
jgi:hypothetical protein